MFALSDHLRDRFALARFIASGENRLALTTMQTIARAFDVSFSPVALVGPQGSGKTHLLVGLGLLIDALHPAKTVRYKSFEEWRTEFESCKDADAVHMWKSAYLSVDVLLLDNARQFIEMPAAVRDELTRVLVSRIQGGNLTMVARDRAPADDPTLDARLRRAFVGGTHLVLDVPRDSLRQAIVRKRLQDRDIRVEDDVIVALRASPTGDLKVVDRAINELLVTRSDDLAGHGEDEGQAYGEFMASLALSIPAGGAPAAAVLQVNPAQVLADLRKRLTAAGGSAIADTLFLSQDKIGWADEDMDAILPDMEELE